MLTLTIARVLPEELPDTDKVTLTWSADAKVDVFEQPDKTAPISSGKQYTLEELPKTLYAEGDEGSGALMDVVFVLTYNADAGPLEDTAKLTVVGAEFQNVWTRNLDPLNQDDMADYAKCIAVEHDDSATLDLENQGYLNIEPPGLTYEDIKEWVDLEVAHQFFDSASMDDTILEYEDDPLDDHEIYAFGLQLTWNGSATVLDRLIIVIYSGETEEEYDDWVAENSVDADWFDELPPVYSALGDNNSNPEPSGCDPQRWKDGVSDEPQSNNYHYNASFSMRSEEIAGGHGHQACYYENGDLIEATPDSEPEAIAAAGTADRVAPGFPYFPHANADAWPFIRAAQLDGNPVEGQGLGGCLTLSDPLIRVGNSLRDYYHRRPPLTDDTVEPGTCCP